MALPCIMEHAWCASSCLILFIRTQNFSTCPLLTCGKASGKNGNLHTIFHVSHTTTLGSGNIWYLIFEGNYFISAPCVSLCHHIRSTVLIFSSANGTWSMNRAMAIGQLDSNQRPTLIARVLLHWAALPWEIWKLYSCRFYLAENCGDQCYRELRTKTESAGEPQVS